jgi:hypothetical protein
MEYDYTTAKEICNEFGCIIGCIHDYPIKPDSVYFLREKDSEGMWRMDDIDFKGFLFCPDCGKQIERRK